MKGLRRAGMGALLLLTATLAACTSSSGDTTATSTSATSSVTLEGFVSDAPLLAGIEPEFEPSDLLDRGEFTLLESDDGDTISAEVAVLDSDDQPMQATATGNDHVLPDGTQVAVLEPEDPSEVLRIEYASETSASVRISSFDSNVFELLFIADRADISETGSLTIDADDYTVVGAARLPFYTGGVRTSYSFGVDGDDGSVNITSFARRGDELDVFDFGPHDAATVGGRDLLYLDQGGGNGSYLFQWDDETLIEVSVFLRPGVASLDDIATLISEVRPTPA